MKTAFDRTCSSTPATVVIDVENQVPEASATESSAANESPIFSHVSYMSIAVPVYNRKNLSLLFNSPQKRYLNTAPAPAPAPAQAVVKEEKVLDFAEAAKSWHPSPEAMATLVAWLQGMKTVCGVYTEDF